VIAILLFSCGLSSVFSAYKKGNRIKVEERKSGNQCKNPKTSENSLNLTTSRSGVA